MSLGSSRLNVYREQWEGESRTPRDKANALDEIEFKVCDIGEDARVNSHISMKGQRILGTRLN